MYQRRNRKTGKRGGHWYISIGQVRVSSKTSDKARAAQLEHKLNAESWDRRNGLVVPSWEQACLTWMDDNPRVSETYLAKKFLTFWQEPLAGKRLDAVTPKLIHSIVAKEFKIDLLNPVGANSTANGYVAIVRRVIRHASNLNPKFTTYPKPAGRDRWLSPDEWGTLAAAMNPDLRDVSLFSLSTGLREGNVIGLKWEWVKGDWLLIPGEFTKTDKPYGIPLNKTAQGIISGRKAMTVRHPELVFLASGKPWYRVLLCRSFKRAVAASGIQEITFHGLRHTFASWLAQKGVSHAIRARLGCWATGSMADHYSHFDVQSLRPFAEMLDQVLAASSCSHQKATA